MLAVSISIPLYAKVSYTEDICRNVAQVHVKHDKADSLDFQKCVQCCGCNSDSMSSLY